MTKQGRGTFEEAGSERKVNREALVDRLRRPEWSDAEFKEARAAVPKSAYEAASAFANTEGGTIVFGVRDREGEVEVVGVDRVDKIQNEFLSTIRSGRKLSREIEVSAEMIEVDGKTLLAFFIPESPRSRKPVYLDGNPRRTFIRRGDSSKRCRRTELERFLRDAAEDRYDSRIVDRLRAHEFFDPESLRWYRSMFFDRNPGKHQNVTDIEFLRERGFVAECGDRLAPTRAAVLVFGRARCVRQILPRPVIDLQFIGAGFDEWSPDRRWADRLVVEENLLQAWLALSERYFRHADRPFSRNMQTMRRNDDPPDFVCFREAAINQLIHQDYGDHGRTAFVRFYRDRTVFWNPGDSLASTDELLDRTAKEVRNPAIVAAFRGIGLSEQAGTGMRAIFGNWRRLGNVPPVVRNDKARGSFELALVRDELLDEDAGSALADDETSDRSPEASSDRKRVEEGGTGTATEPETPKAPAEETVTDTKSDHDDQVGADLIGDHDLPGLTKRQRIILAACDVPRSLTELMERAGVSHRTHFRDKHLKPLLDARLVRMTNPDSPRAPNQKYALTEAGAALKARWAKP